MPSSDAAVLFEDIENEISVTVKTEQVKTSDGLTLRGYQLEYCGPRPHRRRRIIHYLHGTRVYLPNKMNFLSFMSR